MAYISVGERANGAAFSLFIVGFFGAFFASSVALSEIRGIFGIDTLTVKIYKDIQSKNDNNVPSEMREGYEDWLRDNSVEQLQNKNEKENK